MEMLRRVGLADKAQALPRTLSGGQKQRVALVRAMLMHPELLLLDEITAALDPEMVSEVLNVVIDLAEQGMTMAIVTHEMRFAEAVADRVLFMEEGQIVEEGRPGEFFREPQTDRARQFLQSFTYASARKRGRDGFRRTRGGGKFARGGSPGCRRKTEQKHSKYNPEG